MNKNLRIRAIAKIAVFAFMGIFLTMISVSCGNPKTEETAETAQVNEEEFYATQPLHSGLYDASYFCITPVGDAKDKAERKGGFDGRVFFALSPETSAMYVFENGNRTKINYIVNFQKPFEKTDSGYVTLDNKDQLVRITNDSTDLVLNFVRTGEDYSIKFSPKPRYTGTAVEIMEKMAEQKNKK